MATRKSQTLTERLDALETMIIEQRKIIVEQRAEIEALRADVAAQAGSTPEPPVETERSSALHTASRTSRRGLLKLGGVAAIGGVIATAVDSGAVAHAADGNALLIGSASNSNNEATTTTTLSVVPLATPSNLLVIDDSGETGGYGTVSIASGSTSIGVVAQSLGGYGLVADAGGGVDGWIGGFAGNGRLLFNLQSTAGAPTFAAMAGEQIRDSKGDLWLCTMSGFPATWVKVAHLAPGVTNGGAINYLSKPIRLLDTRAGEPAASAIKGAFAANTTHTLQVAGVNYNTVQVPASCAGAVGNLTVIGGAGTGNYVALVPSGAGFSGTANIAFTAGQVVSNSYNVGLDSNGALDIIIGTGGTSGADVILDLFAIVS